MNWKGPRVHLFSLDIYILYFKIKALPLLYTCLWPVGGGTAGSRCQGVQLLQDGAQSWEATQPLGKYHIQPGDHLGSAGIKHGKHGLRYLVLVLYVHRYMMYTFTTEYGTKILQTDTYSHIKTGLRSVVFVGSTTPEGRKLTFKINFHNISPSFMST